MIYLQHHDIVIIIIISDQVADVDPNSELDKQQQTKSGISIFIINLVFIIIIII